MHYGEAVLAAGTFDRRSHCICIQEAERDGCSCLACFLLIQERERDRERQTDRQTDRQTSRDRQTDRQTDRDRGIETQKENENVLAN